MIRSEEARRLGRDRASCRGHSSGAPGAKGHVRRWDVPRSQNSFRMAVIVQVRILPVNCWLRKKNYEPGKGFCMDLVYLNNLDPRSSFDRIVFLLQEPAVTRIKTVGSTRGCAGA